MHKQVVKQGIEVCMQVCVILSLYFELLTKKCHHRMKSYLECQNVEITTTVYKKTESVLPTLCGPQLFIHINLYMKIKMLINAFLNFLKKKIVQCFYFR